MNDVPTLTLPLAEAFLFTLVFGVYEDEARFTNSSTVFFKLEHSSRSCFYMYKGGKIYNDILLCTVLFFQPLSWSTEEQLYSICQASRLHLRRHLLVVSKTKDPEMATLSRSVEQQPSDDCIADRPRWKS